MNVNKEWAEVVCYGENVERQLGAVYDFYDGGAAGSAGGCMRVAGERERG